MLVHGGTEEDNLDTLLEVFTVLRANNLKLRSSKTHLLMKEVEFCGYIISDGKKKPNKKKVEAVLDLKVPQTRQQAQSLFGLLNYHRIFVQNFAAKAVAITKTYRGQFKWTQEADSALKVLKNDIGNAALELKIPDTNNAHFVLETDASTTGYGAVLYVCMNSEMHSHHNSNCLRPVEYASKCFSPGQQKYQILERELFAGREALSKWSHFLLGRKFTWRTDNSCLVWASRHKSRNMKVSTWLAIISEFDYDIELRPSKSMKISDCLSRQFVELNEL